MNANSSLLNRELSRNWYEWASAILIISLSSLPLLLSFPYRVNIFLSWEGAYRIYLGQMPYRDFGLPLGFSYWVIPALFFKIFGPYMASLIKAQVFINIVSGLSFKSICSSLGLKGGKIFVAVFFFCLTYSFFNFWPWYNQTVVVFQLVSLAALFRSFGTNQIKWKIGLTIGSGLMSFLAFFTKQDSGALAILLNGVLIVYHTIQSKSMTQLITFVISVLLIAIVVIYPFTFHEFGYWFNYGQPPHYSRFDTYDLLSEFLLESKWLKVYISILFILTLLNFSNRKFKDWFFDHDQMLLILLTFGVLCQASIIQVTSYTPPNNNIYFHSFFIVFILSMLKGKFNFQLIYINLLALFFILFTWSGVYFNYIDRIIKRIIPQNVSPEDNKNIVSKNTFMIRTDSTAFEGESEWISSGLKAFDPLYMPESTVKGIYRLKEMSEFTGKERPKVLNMTELTPLAYELNFELEKGQPLWYHLGVSMFNREVEYFCEKISKKHYDIILFEDIPSLNNFYPYPILECIKKNYHLTDQFLAPRRPTNATIGVYRK